MKLWRVYCYEVELSLNDVFIVVAETKEEAEKECLFDGYYTKAKAEELDIIDGYRIKLEKINQ